jgi:hypothetical protein
MNPYQDLVDEPAAANPYGDLLEDKPKPSAFGAFVAAAKRAPTATGDLLRKLGAKATLAMPTSTDDGLFTVTPEAQATARKVMDELHAKESTLAQETQGHPVASFLGGAVGGVADPAMWLTPAAPVTRTGLNALERFSPAAARAVTTAAAKRPVVAGVARAAVEGGAFGGTRQAAENVAEGRPVTEGTLGAALTGAGTGALIHGTIGTAKATARTVTDTLPKHLVTSALKLPLSQKWKKFTLMEGPEGEQVVNERTRAVDRILEDKVPANEAGIAQTIHMSQQRTAAIDAATQQAAQQGATVNVPKTVKQGLANLRAKVSDEPHAAEKLAEIDAWEKAYIADHGQVPEVDVHQTNALKRGLWRAANWSKVNRVGASWEEEANRQVGNAFKKAIEAKVPGIKEMNAEEGATILMLDALSAAVPRIQNRDTFGLGAKILLTGNHAPLALLEHAAGRPSYRVWVAQKLYRSKAPRGAVPESGPAPQESIRLSPDRTAPAPETEAIESIPTFMRRGAPIRSARESAQVFENALPQTPAAERAGFWENEVAQGHAPIPESPLYIPKSAAASAEVLRNAPMGAGERAGIGPRSFREPNEMIRRGQAAQSAAVFEKATAEAKTPKAREELLRRFMQEEQKIMGLADLPMPKGRR